MNLSLHPHTRKSIQKLHLPGPLRKHYANIHCKVDLSESTNPYSPYLPDYPNIDPLELKHLYLDYINNPHLGTQNCLFTVGSVDGLDLLLRGFAEPYKDIVCLTDPTFSAYQHWASLYDLPIETVSLQGEDFEKVSIEAITRVKPKIFILCNPNNPTGTVVTPGTIERICQAIPGLVIIDEAYIEFSSHKSSVDILHHYNNLIILRTLSKGWGMAGARCGIVLADERIINTLLYIQSPFSFSRPAQNWVHRCLTHTDPIKQSWVTICQDRDHLMKQLHQMDCIDRVYPSQSNFVMVTFKDFDDSFSKLLSHGIYVADTSNVIPNSIKISISTRENNETLVSALSGESLSIVPNRRIEKASNKN